MAWNPAAAWQHVVLARRPGLRIRRSGAAVADPAICRTGPVARDDGGVAQAGIGSQERRPFVIESLSHIQYRDTAVLFCRTDVWAAQPPCHRRVLALVGS